MNWRHIAFIMGSVIILILLAQFWFSTYVVPAQKVHEKSYVTAPPPAPVLSSPNIEVNDYRIEEIDAYRFNVRYSVTNTGDKPAHNVRLTIRPWKKIPTPDHPDANLPGQDSPLRSVAKIDILSEVKPHEKIDRSIAFDRPNGTTDPLPPNAQFRETFVIEFDSK